MTFLGVTISPVYLCPTRTANLSVPFFIPTQSNTVFDLKLNPGSGKIGAAGLDTELLKRHAQEPALHDERSYGDEKSARATGGEPACHN